MSVGSSQISIVAGPYRVTSPGFLLMEWINAMFILPARVVAERTLRLDGHRHAVRLCANQTCIEIFG